MRFLLALSALCFLAPCASADDAAPAAAPNPYYAALSRARDRQRMCLLIVAPAAEDAAWTGFERAALADARNAALLRAWETDRLTTEQTYLDEKGETRRLIDHLAFHYLRRGPGLAAIDYQDRQSPHYAKVVSLIPWEPAHPLTARDLTVLLELPAGSLTQRAMIYAVRTHPDRPASTSGQFHPLLAHEAAAHATHQATIRLQGHHNWDRRFHSINARMGNGLIAQEVCAESWPGEDLFEAARECVHSWRQSSGHWSAVSGKQTAFAYDLARGTNGIWYGVGIFAK